MLVTGSGFRSSATETKAARVQTAHMASVSGLNWRTRKGCTKTSGSRLPDGARRRYGVATQAGGAKTTR